MTKKAVELVTRTRGFHKKKHPAFSQKSVMEQQLPHSLHSMERNHQKEYGAREILKTYNEMPCMM